MSDRAALFRSPSERRIAKRKRIPVAFMARIMVRNEGLPTLTMFEESTTRASPPPALVAGITTDEFTLQTAA
jgi:hypothetical protein